MNRRKLLLASGVSLSTVLAGCAGGDEDEDNADENGEEPETDPDDNGDEPQPDEQEPDQDDGDDGTDEDDDDEVPRSGDTELLSVLETLDADEPLFDPGTETFDGDSDAVTDEISLGGALTVVVAEFDDEGMENYQVNLEGEADELLVNALEGGTYAGAVPTPNGDYLFDVTSPGGWELTVGQPLAPPEEVRTLPVEASGDGPDVVGPVELDGGLTVAGEFDGEENFQVHIYDEDDSGQFDGELVFNEIGEYDGETRADYTGICWIDVEADGSWSLELE